MTDDRGLSGLEDIKGGVGRIRRLVAGKTLDDLRRDEVAWAAFERFLEVISEASRSLPDGWKAEQPQIPWRQVADLGNRLRHVYRDVNPQALWAIYENDLDPLEAAIDAMLAAHTPKDSSP